MSFIDRVKEKNGMEFAKDLIEQFMKKNKIYSADELLNKYPTLKDFSAKTKYDNYINIIRNHGLPNFDENKYKEIIELIKEEDNKKKLNTDNIETTNINGHEIVSVTDTESNEEIIYDNTASNKNFKDEMKEIQDEHKQFQSKDNNNTLGVMNYMKDNVKITPKFDNSIEKQNDDNEEIDKIKDAVKEFEDEIGHSVKVDFITKMIYDNNIVYSIEKQDDKYVIVKQMDNNKSKSKQLTKKMNVA